MEKLKWLTAHSTTMRPVGMNENPLKDKMGLTYCYRLFPQNEEWSSLEFTHTHEHTHCMHTHGNKTEKPVNKKKYSIKLLKREEQYEEKKNIHSLQRIFKWKKRKTEINRKSKTNK